METKKVAKEKSQGSERPQKTTKEESKNQLKQKTLLVIEKKNKILNLRKQNKNMVKKREEIVSKSKKFFP